MAYDIVGDIHGQADKLEALLETMGYQRKAGAYRHPSRTAIFVGDFIDRGPRQVDSCRLVREMVDAGSAQAVMGNHEFNAVAWFMQDPEGESAEHYLRPRHGEKGIKNRHQHQAFLAEVEGTPMHKELIDWFLTLPLWLELPELRVVHACWHDGLMSSLAPLLGPGRTLTPKLMVRASREDDQVFEAVEALTKGIEVPLPDGHFFLDKDGNERRNVRIRWWEEGSDTYRDLAIMPEPERQLLPDLPLNAKAKPVYDKSKPVFYGHYWMQGDPVLQGSHFACVDYSAGKGGPMVAYRWKGEQSLDPRNFVRAG
ncbi:metallophosphoesterase [Hydrogenophaga pseudoflava]|uniref:metallophosphoesterase n=1 Tax=Hydrogenophaga pseudoflava TaxID=47421 RepID=UPI000826E73C|nr:metallophosphoesterase [Hydrogenophaga pseudoflava]